VKRPSIAIVGPGRLGTALAASLKQSGYEISEIVSRSERKSVGPARILARKVGVRASANRSAQLDADVIWFCVPDSKVAEAAREYSGRDWKGKVAFHSSGVLTSDALQNLRDRGASVASAHPLMTFVRGSVPDLSGVTFAMEGDPRAVGLARRIVRDLGGEMLLLRKQDKAAYHAFATMICPLLITLLASAEQTAGLAGITRMQARRRMLPIVEKTLQNYAQLGAAKAFTGPIVRGDLETVGRHLKVLARTPAVQNAYAALAQAALEYLPSRNRRELKTLLGTRKSNSSRRVYTESHELKRKKIR
jgi:predicted short-subunit dehydrogenase-like oxidoreductase (DUF2520 family)